MKPTHRLRVLDKRDDSRGELGAGWLNPDGSISIKINPGVLITKNKDQVITLFPDTPRPASAFEKQVQDAYKKGPLAAERDKEEF